MGGQEGGERTEEIGTYYTPKKIATSVLSMATLNETTAIFDPCFGHAALLNGAIDVMKGRKIPSPGCNLAGVDVDPEARKYLNSVYRNGGSEHNFLIADFLAVRPSVLKGAPFNLIICNPPFVRHHDIPKSKREIAVRALEEHNTRVPLTSAYWAYFLSHSLIFLERDAEILFLLPIAFLQSDYARNIRRLLVNRFQEVVVIVPGNGFFPRVQERVIILHGRRYDLGPGSLKLRILEASQKAPLQLASVTSYDKTFADDAKGWAHELLQREAQESYDRVVNLPVVSRLVTWAKLSIGTVTGANAFFILSRSKTEQLEIEKSGLKSIITSSRYLRGMSFGERDFRSIDKNDKPCWLLFTRGLRGKPVPLIQYLREGEAKGIHLRSHCRRRSLWYDLENPTVPDAFLHYMSGVARHIVLNESESGCTNAIHQVRWKRGVTTEIASAVVASFLSTLTQLSCEIRGRRYGGGVLKLEIHEAEELPILVPSLESVSSTEFSRIDDLLRSGNLEAAMDKADRIALSASKDISQADFDIMRQGWNELVGDRLRR